MPRAIAKHFEEGDVAERDRAAFKSRDTRESVCARKPDPLGQREEQAARVRDASRQVVNAIDEHGRAGIAPANPCGLTRQHGAGMYLREGLASS